MSAVVNVGRSKIGQGQDVFVIAEVGINHNGDFDTARELVDQARQAGASAVKLQTYITEKRVAKGSPIFDILKKCELSFQQQKQLFDHAREQGIEIFSTPFDAESVDFLASVKVPCYKIASFDLVNRQLLRKVAQQGQPVIISRGMASRGEIDAAVGICQEFAIPFVLLHCVSAYPVKQNRDLNLRTIQALQESYRCPVGYSDHTLGIEACAYAVAAGAVAIEKHFTLSRQAPGPDHALSIEPQELRVMIEKIRIVKEALGEPVWAAIPAEQDILQYRRAS